MNIRVWLRRLAFTFVFLLALSYAFSFALRLGRVHRYLERRLGGAFGRPVEVGRFGFSLMAGPRLEAERVTVGEDPAFGNEYFLRAERLAAGLRWGQLANGRFEFGTLSFTRPSLNLVRDTDGHWNVERWLPPRTSGPSQVSTAGAARLYRIDFDTGRINLKYGPDKRAFALVDVDGTVEQEARGLWRLDLRARPARAGVNLQEAGRIRVRGRIAGTSARLRPAEILLEWEAGSLADVLRLARGQDFGVRGGFGMELTARTAPGEPAGGEPAKWQFALRARVSRVHRWDLTERADNPALNLNVDASWNAADGQFRLAQVVLEGPRSQIRATGEARIPPALDPRVEWESPGVHLADLLAWVRAFRPGAAEGLRAEGRITGSLVMRGWPPRIETARLESPGGAISASGAAARIRWGPIEARTDRNFLTVPMTEFSLEPEPNVATPRPDAARPGQFSSQRQSKGTAAPNSLILGVNYDLVRRRASWVLRGHVSHTEDLFALAAAFGWTINRGWELHGGADAELHGRRDPGGTWAVEGPVYLRNAQLHVAGLNSPVEIETVGITWAWGAPQAMIQGANAFGAKWSGTISKNDGSEGAQAGAWRFRLHADRLSATELDRWLGPRARPNWLERLLPGLLGAERTVATVAAGRFLRNVRAQGELTADEFALGALKLKGLRAQTAIGGSKVSVSEGEAELAGGRVKGSLEVSFASRPRYEAAVSFERVDVAVVAAANPSLRDLVGGQASAELHLTGQGIGREELLASLEGKGKARLSSAEFYGCDVDASLADGVERSGLSRWAGGEAEFSIERGVLRMDSLRLRSGRSGVVVKGTVGFNRVADLRVETLPLQSASSPGGAAPRSLRLVGPVEALRVTIERAKPAPAQAN